MVVRLKYCQTPFRFIQSFLCIDGRGYSCHTLSGVSCSPQGVISGAVCFFHWLAAQTQSVAQNRMVKITTKFKIVFFFIFNMVCVWLLAIGAQMYTKIFRWVLLRHLLITFWYKILFVSHLLRILAAKLTSFQYYGRRIDRGYASFRERLFLYDG